MGDSISEIGISDCLHCYKAMNGAEKSFSLAHRSHVIEFPSLLSGHRVCLTQQPNGMFFPRALLYSGQSQSSGGQKKTKLVQSLNSAKKQSKLISGGNEGQPYTRLSRILLVRMWDLVFPGRISSCPDHLCWKSG